jgi:hypothetical protein
MVRKKRKERGDMDDFFFGSPIRSFTAIASRGMRSGENSFVGEGAQSNLKVLSTT